MLHDMFALQVPLLEKIMRPLLVYVALIVLLRIFGKRELAQLNPFDLIVLLTLSNTVQNAIIGNDNSLLGGLIGALALQTGNYLVVRFVLRHRRLDQVLEGKPSVLIQNGRIHTKALARELMTASELAVVARRQGYRSLAEIERCVLEPGGAFVFTPEEHAVPSTEMQRLLQRLDDIQAEIHALRGTT